MDGQNEAAAVFDLMANTIISQDDENNALREALIKCRDKLAEYVTYHAAKGTDDSLKKAAVNQEMVDMANKALSVVASKPE